MPPAPAIAAALGVTLATAQIISAAVTIAITIGLSLASSFLFRPAVPKGFGSDFTNDSSGRTQQFRQPIAAQQIVYGRQRVSGPIVFIGSTEDNKYLHMIIPVAAHEIDGFEAFFFDDYVVYPSDLNEDGAINQGRFAGKVRIKTGLGADDQEADSYITSAVPDWTPDHRGRGIAYMYIEFEYSRSAFPTGVPKVSAVIRGKKVEDPRDGGSPATVRWSQNAALCLNDFLRRETKLGGVGASETEIDSASLIAAANACDEFPATRTVHHDADQQNDISVADNTIKFADEALKFQVGDKVQVSSSNIMAGGLAADTDYYVIVKHFLRRLDDEDNFNAYIQIQLAATYEDAEAGTAVDITSTGIGTLRVTKVAEPRYTANGLIKTDKTPLGQTVEDMRSAMGGAVIYSGGVFRFKAGVWEEPSVSFDEDDVRSRISTPTKRSRRERFNAVKGNYSSPLNNWQPQPYPQIVNSVYEAEDGGERIFTNLELPFTSRANTAQRLASIHLKRNRNQIGVDLPLNMAGLQVRPGNVVYFNNIVRGWENKTFEVISWSLAVEGEDNPVLVTNLSLISSDSEDYDFNPNLEEQEVTPVVTTTLPNPFTVAAPTGLSTNAERIDTEQGDGTYKITVSWNPSTNFFVLEDGRYEVQFKLNAASTWRPSFNVPGDQESADIPQVRYDESYDVRVRALNHLGVPSAWSTLTNFSVTNPGGAGTTLDWGSIIDAVVDSEDWGLITDGAGSPTTDWGSIT